MKPAYDKLGEEYKDSSSVVIGVRVRVAVRVRVRVAAGVGAGVGLELGWGWGWGRVSPLSAVEEALDLEVL